MLVYKLGALLYGRRAGAIAALFMALMPYHVLVTRQILLDGPMTLFATLTLYLIARYATRARGRVLYAAGAAMGLAVLSKETAIVLLGGDLCVLCAHPEIRLRVRDVVGSLALFGGRVHAVPDRAQPRRARTDTGGNYLAWQLFRRPNHEWTFYPTDRARGDRAGCVIAAAVAGLWLLRRERSWRETLLLCWIAVPVVFFQVWPVKGFQYLLPAAPAVAILAARALTRWSPRCALAHGSRAATAAWFAPAAVGRRSRSRSVLSSLERIQPSPGGKLLAGSGGVPGGREAGEWIDRTSRGRARS